MFEKIAQEWVKAHTKIENKGSYVELKGPSAIESFEAGAQFGYNKCKEELNQKGLALQSDMDKTIEQNIALKKKLNKANEWYFVSEKGLPKESGRYLVYVGGGENGVYPLDFDTEANDFGYWCLDVGDSLGVRDTIFETITERNEDKVIAWKEIVLPEQEG